MPPKKDVPPNETDALTPGLIHELRHPLTGLKASLHFVEKDLPPGTVADEDWREAKLQLRRMEEILQQYQDFLQPENAQQRSFAAVPVVHAATDMVRYRVRQVGAKLSVELPKDSPLAVGTPSVLSHALTNLLLNALDALEEVGTGRLAVRLATDDAGQRVTVRVSDEGTGISPGAAERLFSEGFTTKPAGKGSGLGLKVSRRLLSAFGGSVSLVTAEDPERTSWAKTEFLVTLPMATAS